MKDAKTQIILSYALSALFILSQLAPATGIAGLVCLLVAMFIVYARKNPAGDPVIQNHVRWQIRTFWIGGLAVIPLSALVLLALVFYFTDYSMVVSGDIISYNAYLSANMGAIIGIMLATFAPVCIWWMFRCWRGFIALRRNMPVENVTSWL